MKRLFALVLAVVAVNAMADRVPPGTNDEIRARLAPVGALCKVGESCGQVAAAVSGGGGLGLSGEEVYKQFCFACHDAGVGGAPLLHDVDAWAPRLAQDADILWQHTLNGINAMPPKGTCMGCSDDELKAATAFMSGPK